MDAEPFQILLGVSCLLIGFGLGWAARWWKHRHDTARAMDRVWRRIEDQNRQANQP